MKLKIEYSPDYVKPVLEGGLAWKEALLSGKYKKGTGRLCYDNDGVKQYCCLGVKCEIDNNLYLKNNNYFNGNDNNTYLSSYNPFYKILGSEDGTFPDGFTLRFDNIYRTKDLLCKSLADLNDAVDDFETVVEVLEAAWTLQ